MFGWHLCQIYYPLKINLLLSLLLLLLSTHSKIFIFVSKLIEESSFNNKCNEGTCTVQFIKELDMLLGGSSTVEKKC